MFGRQTRIPLDLMFRTPVSEIRNANQYVWTLGQSLQDAVTSRKMCMMKEFISDLVRLQNQEVMPISCIVLVQVHTKQ